MPDLVSPDETPDTNSESTPEVTPEITETREGLAPDTSDSPVIRVGCAGLPAGLARPQYFERLAYLEASSTLFGLPKTAIQKRWRADAGEAGRMGLFAPQVITHRPGPRGYARSKEKLSPEALAQAGGFRATPVVRDAVEALAAAAVEMAAEAVIFRSPPDFAPSAANRDTMRGFFRDIAPAERFGGAVRVWEPQGLWELPVAARLAGELGLVLACDPLDNDPLAPDPDIYSHLPGDEVYFRVTGMGSSRSRFDGYAMETLLDTAASYTRTWMVFANPGKYPDAIRFRRLLAAHRT